MKRNVLHLIGSFHQGGSERQAVQLAHLLCESNHYRVHIACLNRSGMLLEEAERLDIGEIPEFPLTSFYDRNAIKQLRRFARFLQEREIDIVHTHDFYTNVFGITGAALARVPARISARRETEGFRTLAQKRIERAIYHLSHTIIANAEAVKQQLIKEGVREQKIVTIYNGLDVKRVTTMPALERDEALALFDLPREKERRFVTIIANLHHPVKDYPTFLRAVQRVCEAVPQVAFIIAGEGALMESMRSLAAQLGLEQSVFFIGRCERIAEVLFVSDVCVLSSKAEGFSNSILEYMAASRPVVATDVGGAREAIVEGETGYLVRAGDDEAMAKRIISLLQDPEKGRLMGKRGRRIIEERFSCEAQLAETQKLYERLAAQSHIVQLKPSAESVRRERF